MNLIFFLFLSWIFQDLSKNLLHVFILLFLGGKIRIKIQFKSKSKKSKLLNYNLNLIFCFGSRIIIHALSLLLSPTVFSPPSRIIFFACFSFNIVLSYRYVFFILILFLLYMLFFLYCYKLILHTFLLFFFETLKQIFFNFFIFSSCFWISILNFLLSLRKFYFQDNIEIKFYELIHIIKWSIFLAKRSVTTNKFPFPVSYSLLYI